jgi:hypothetical protein
LRGIDEPERVCVISAQPVHLGRGEGALAAWASGIRRGASSGAGGNQRCHDNARVLLCANECGAHKPRTHPTAPGGVPAQPSRRWRAAHALPAYCARGEGRGRRVRPARASSSRGAWSQKKQCRLCRSAWVATRAVVNSIRTSPAALLCARVRAVARKGRPATRHASRIDHRR